MVQNTNLQVVEIALTVIFNTQGCKEYRYLVSRLSYDADLTIYIHWIIVWPTRATYSTSTASIVSITSCKHNCNAKSIRRSINKHGSAIWQMTTMIQQTAITHNMLDASNYLIRKVSGLISNTFYTDSDSKNFPCSRWGGQIEGYPGPFLVLPLHSITVAWNVIILFAQSLYDPCFPMPEPTSKSA